MATVRRRQGKSTSLAPLKEEPSAPQSFDHYDSTERAILKHMSTADDTLNHHVLANIPLKLVDFSLPQNYERLQLKKPDSKKQHYEQMLEKLGIMLDLTYEAKDYNQLKFYHLNSDQLLTVLKARSFLEKADPERVVDCLKALQKSRQLKMYEREEIVQAVKSIALNPQVLKSLPQSYFASFVHCVSKMQLDDELVWFSLADHVSRNHTTFTVRSLATITYALTAISKRKPVILNFDKLYKSLELTFVKKFAGEGSKGQDIAMVLMSYSKSQNGSVQFW